MALANVNVCGPKTARVCAIAMKMNAGAKVGRSGAMSRVVRVRASAEKIDFNDEGAFTLPGVFGRARGERHRRGAPWRAQCQSFSAFTRRNQN